MDLRDELVRLAVIIVQVWSHSPRVGIFPGSRMAAICCLTVAGAAKSLQKYCAALLFFL